MIGFSKSESQKIKIDIDKLYHYLQQDNFVLVGGLVIRHHLISRGIDYPPRPINDLDVIVINPSLISTLIQKDFLIYHYHPDNFYLALVDPITKIKIDIFNYDPIPQQMEQIDINNKGVNIISIEDQLVKTVLDIQRISSKFHVDPKQFLDMKLLTKIANIKKSNYIWQSHKFKKYPSDINNAIQRAEKIVAKHPEWLEKNPFRKKAPYKCIDCKNANGFSIDQMNKIYNILGYTE